MKKYSLLFAFTLYVFAACAQVDKQASDLLKKVSLKYKSYASLKTDYSIKIHFADAKTDIIKKGILYLKGAKFKMQIDK